jgi:hypothetical protein
MEKTTDRLYELLPLIYRMRDAEQGYPLQALLRVVTEQVNVVEADIDQLYDNWFIETCAEWLVPYVGELVGYRLVHEAGEPGEITTPQGRRRNKILIPRREVANTVAYRRRKGTLALLELLANDVAGWPARAVEFFKLLGWAQHLNHLRPARGRTVDMRQGQALDYLDGPFDQLAHAVDVRRINSQRTHGRYNIPSVGLFIWRLKVYSVTKTAAYCLEQVSPRAYTFSILGNDTPLYNKPQPEPEATHIAEPLNLPITIRRRPFEDEVRVTDERGNEYTQASADYYGAGKSLLIWVPDWPRKGAEQPIPRSQIIPADLSDWQYLAPRNHIAVDPERGRIIFPSRQLPRQGVWVTYHYAFSADIGGGEYERPLSQPSHYKLYRVCPDKENCYQTIGAALTAWANEEPKPLSAVIEIDHNGVYTEPLRFSLGQNEYLQIRAANGKRPVIRLLDYMAERPDAFMITGEAGSRLVLDGLLIFGRGLQIHGPERDHEAATAISEDLCRITIRHCTLVPGWSLENDCKPQRPSEPSLELIDTQARVSIERSIIGSIQVTADAVQTDPIPIHISDSILDATSADCDEPHCEALGAPGWPLAHAILTIRRSTVFGRIHIHAIELAENSIFMGCITVGRRQSGCMRFCYVTPGSRTPRRYRCQPDLAQQVIAETLRQAAQDSEEPEPDEATIQAAQALEQERVRPQFNSTRYGVPTYCQLATACAEEIKRGADDESEMGVFHDLYQPQRAANLRTRLDEYTPAGMNAGLILVN